MVATRIVDSVRDHDIFCTTVNECEMFGFTHNIYGIVSRHAEWKKIKMLYIMRHGRTDWNVRKKMQGWTDIPLNDEGRQMAIRAGEECKDIHFDICYCSPLIRARETAELVLRNRNVPIITDKRLVEMSFGEYEGIENSFSIPDCPINVLFFEPEKYVSVGGSESFDELFARTGEFLQDMVYPDLNAGKDVLIVGHGAMNSSIICQVKNLPLKDFWSAGIENCKLLSLPIENMYSKRI